MKKLNEENLQKYEFLVEDITWLGFRVTQNGVTTTEHKSKAIIQPEAPRSLKQLQ